MMASRPFAKITNFLRNEIFGIFERIVEALQLLSAFIGKGPAQPKGTDQPFEFSLRSLAEAF